MSTFGRVIRIILLVFFAIDVLALFVVMVTSAYAQSLDWQKALIIISFIFFVLCLGYQILCLVKDEHIILNFIANGFSSIDTEVLKKVGLVLLAIIFLPITIIVGIVYLIIHLVKDYKPKKKSTSTWGSKSKQKKDPYKSHSDEFKEPNAFMAVFFYKTHPVYDKIKGKKGFYCKTLKYTKDFVTCSNDKQLVWCIGKDIVEHREEIKQEKRDDRYKLKREREAARKEAYKRKMIAKLDYYEKHKKMKKYYELRDWCWDHGIIEMPPHLKKMREEWAAERRAEREKERKEHEAWLKEQREKERRRREIQRDESGKIIYPDADDVEDYLSGIRYVYSGNYYGDISNISVSGYGGNYSVVFDIDISADFGGLEGEISSSSANYIISLAKQEIINKAREMKAINRISVSCSHYSINR